MEYSSDGVVMEDCGMTRIQHSNAPVLHYRVCLGHTLVELMTAVAVTAIAALIMLTAFTATRRLWLRYDTKRQAQETAWSAYGTLSQAIRSSTRAVVGGNGDVTLYCGDDSTGSIRHSGDTLMVRNGLGTRMFVDTRAVLAPAPQGAGTNVWECSVCSRVSGASRTIKWRAVALGVSRSGKLPVSRATPVTVDSHNQ